MVNGRQKGAAFERQIAGMLHDELGIKFRRNLDQYQQKGLDDLTPDQPFPFMLELKRYKDRVEPGWWDQICSACRSGRNANDAFPALIWKLDRQPINVRIPIEALVVLGRDDAATHDPYDWRYTATLSWGDWIMVCRELLSCTKQS
ncbi:MAG: hypothetical protein VW014_00070 [Halieaceae bacterium]|jgi:hypothetical protein|nr:hypothetical protein [Parvibaculum sp.]